jgi:hypothetical protein
MTLLKVQKCTLQFPDFKSNRMQSKKRKTQIQNANINSNSDNEDDVNSSHVPIANARPRDFMNLFVERLIKDCPVTQSTILKAKMKIYPNKISNVEFYFNRVSEKKWRISMKHEHKTYFGFQVYLYKNGETKLKGYAHIGFNIQPFDYDEITTQRSTLATWIEELFTHHMDRPESIYRDLTPIGTWRKDELKLHTFTDQKMVKTLLLCLIKTRRTNIITANVLDEVLGYYFQTKKANFIHPSEYQTPLRTLINY